MAEKRTGKRWSGKKNIKQTADAFTNKRLLDTSAMQAEEVFAFYQNNIDTGYDNEIAEEMRDKYGANVISQQKRDSLFKRLFVSFVNPFTVVLLVLAAISLFTDVIFAEERDVTAVVIVLAMVTISGILHFIQDTRSNNAAAQLSAYIHTTTCVLRCGQRMEIPLEEVVVGDIVYLAAGDMIPADMRVVSSKDLFVSQSSLTGESVPLEKVGAAQEVAESTSPLDQQNLTFTGSTVVSGSASCLAVSVGDNTIFGAIAKTLTEKKTVTSFEKGVNSVSKLLIQFMLIMVPVVFFANWATKGNPLDALLFGLSIAVGLTPEMLPMIVTTNLAKGAVKMARKKTVVKNLSSIQNFGAMDVLCTDKTGTLTQDKIILEKYMDIRGDTDSRTLRHAYLNSYFQTGLKNLMDLAILNHGQEDELESRAMQYIKVDEIPFDFSRRRMSVVIKDGEGKTQLITKGAVEEILDCCEFAEYKGEVSPLKDQVKDDILATVEKLNSQGMRVLAVAQKTNPDKEGMFSVKDESDMVLIGYLAFLDPPKESSASAIKALKEYGVDVKVLTGDSATVTKSICKQVGLRVDNILLGSDVENMEDDQLSAAVEETNVFAKLSPSQKTRIVHMLRNNGHVVGFMGDGINDAAAMKEADVGISVDTAVDIAKESADIILLEKDLMVLERGVIEGRRTFANIVKYIKMTASSNFGNILSMLVASVLLPFLPMLPIQILTLNLIYDISCISIPWDNVDSDYLKKPKKWESDSIKNFMFKIGPTSSVFDITTYALMFFVICPLVAGGTWNILPVDSEAREIFEATFHAGWFVESLWSQTLVIHMIRTPKVPFIESRASAPVLLVTTLAILAGTLLTVISAAGEALKMNSLPANYFVWLPVIILGYMTLVTLVKKSYVKKYGQLL